MITQTAVPWHPVTFLQTRKTQNVSFSSKCFMSPGYYIENVNIKQVFSQLNKLIFSLGMTVRLFYPKSRGYCLENHLMGRNCKLAIRSISSGDGPFHLKCFSVFLISPRWFVRRSSFSTMKSVTILSLQVEPCEGSLWMLLEGSITGC